jgi:hypothetical protein
VLPGAVFAPLHSARAREGLHLRYGTGAPSAASRSYCGKLSTYSASFICFVAPPCPPMSTPTCSSPHAPLKRMRLAAIENPKRQRLQQACKSADVRNHLLDTRKIMLRIPGVFTYLRVAVVFTEEVDVPRAVRRPFV